MLSRYPTHTHTETQLYNFAIDTNCKTNPLKPSSLKHDQTSFFIHLWISCGWTALWLGWIALLIYAELGWAV